MIAATAGVARAETLAEASKRLQEAQRSFNTAYLQLQSQIQSASRRFTTLSNVVRARHDAGR
jgi:prefoldin subunit 5